MLQCTKSTFCYLIETTFGSTSESILKMVVIPNAQENNSQQTNSIQCVITYIAIVNGSKINYMFFFYKHSVFQAEARICLSFSQIEPQNMLKICLS